MGSKKVNVKNIFRKGNKKDPREAQSSQFYLSGPEHFWKLFAGTWSAGTWLGRASYKQIIPDQPDHLPYLDS